MVKWKKFMKAMLFVYLTRISVHTEQYRKNDCHLHVSYVKETWWMFSWLWFIVMFSRISAIVMRHSCPIPIF